jgi:hypothetical protein
MKQFAALILLSLFVCTQYNRQLAYLDCKLDNIRNTTESKCDCEQQYGSSQDDEKSNFPAHKNHHHLAIDDFYFYEIKQAPCFYFASNTKYPLLNIHFTSKEFKDVFHPPKA